MKKNQTASTAVAEREDASLPQPPAAYEPSESEATEASRPLTIRVRGMSATEPIKTMEPGGGEKLTRYGYWRGQILGEDVPEWARKMGCVRNPGAFYWPPDAQAEYDVTLQQLEEIKADKYVVISYDPAEEQMLRARLAPTEAAREAGLKAARLEADLAAANARAKMLAAQAAAAEAEKQVAEANARLALEEARLRARG